MTSRERAFKLVVWMKNHGFLRGGNMEMTVIENSIAVAIDEAVAEEREACAKVAEARRGTSTEPWWHGFNAASLDIAAAIRARGKP